MTFAFLARGGATWFLGQGIMFEVTADDTATHYSLYIGLSAKTLYVLNTSHLLWKFQDCAVSAVAMTVMC
jgi:hypothetical protein